MMFEFIAEPGIIVANAQATTTTERLKLISVALGKLAHAYDYGHNGEVAQARERWALITSGAVAALEDPAQYYRRTGETPERAAILGERVRLAMQHSKWGVREDEHGNAIAITSTQGVHESEYETLTTLAVLAVRAAEALKGEVSAETLSVKRMTAVTGNEESGRRRWTGLLATRLDRPELLEAETKHVLLTMLAALINEHNEIKDWIPRDRDPSVRLREPRGHPGLPLIVAPFVMETEAAWEAVEAGDLIDQAYAKTVPTVEALTEELAEGPARAS